MTPAPTVHMVDDDPSVLRALSRLLAGAGHPCETWPSAEAFLGRSRSPADGCAILDLRLPGASGLELQASLAGADPTLPVVFLTAGATSKPPSGG